MLFSKNHFDELRVKMARVTTHDTIKEVINELIDGQEKLYRMLTETPVDITKHDGHLGRVELEGD